MLNSGYIIFFIISIILIYLIIKNNNKEHYTNKTKYCSINGVCTNTKNDCGYNTHLDRMNTIYYSKRICEENIDKCNIYNNRINQCLQQSDCGVCSDKYGNKICVNATPIGPYNLDYTCRPQKGTSKNNFVMGQPNEYIQPTYPNYEFSNTLPEICK